MEGDSLYYGLNAVSNNMIMADRKQLKNPNGLILGTPGSGKSFSAKREITNVFFTTTDDIIVADPEGEYYPLVEALGGQVAWNEAAKEVTLTVNGKEIKMTIGKALEKYGVAPVIIGGRTFVPVRFVADELGAVTTWDDATKTVTIQAVK